MFQIADLDDREKQIMESADSWWAMRFIGSGNYDRLGPYKSLEQVILQVRAFFKNEDRQNLCPPPSYIANRPFLIYAAASKLADAQVVIGNVYRDGALQPGYAEVRRRMKEERELAAAQRRSRNKPGTT